ncbi:MAG: hypothetical protein AAF208_02765 [Cyanobacteria bacterium P01_A01_bin.45]
MSVNKNQEELLEALSNDSYEELRDKLMKKWLESLYTQTEILKQFQES